MTQKQKEAVARAMKGLRFSVKSADEGTVTAIFSRFNVKDLDGDVTMPGAFEDGAEVLISAYNHETWCGGLPVGKGVIHCDDEKAWLDGQFFLDTQAGKETFTTVKNVGDLQEWSYGYKVLETGEVTDAMYQQGVWRVLKKLKVWEVSPVMVGAGIGTETVSIKSAENGGEEPGTKADGEPQTAPSAEEIAAKAAVTTDAMREFARFQKTRARLIVAGAA
jgi:HK97 family phage prohead protease